MRSISRPKATWAFVSLNPRAASSTALALSLDAWSLIRGESRSALPSIAVWNPDSIRPFSELNTKSV